MNLRTRWINLSALASSSELKATATVGLVLLLASPALPCSLDAFNQQRGLQGKTRGSGVEITWDGERGAKLRAWFDLADGQPLIRELAARSGGGRWRVVAEHARPEFHVTAGTRRISNQQLNPLKALGVELTDAVIEKEKWKVFWDAPLEVPGIDGVNVGTPRQANEVIEADAKFASTGCEARANGSRVEVEFDGVTAGPFSGKLRYTVYRGSNLLRQELIASTERPSTAYKYRGGISGLNIDDAARISWRDIARAEQHYLFGSSEHDDPVPVRARNRLAVIDWKGGGSLAYFPAPHKFFWAREIERNLGYVYYRKDSEETFSVGVRQGDHEEMYSAYGIDDEIWERRSRQAHRFARANFALYNAPTGSEQRMAVYFHLSPEGSGSNRETVLAYTNRDRYPALDGYKVAVSHFHTHFNEYVQDRGSLDARPAWIPAFRALGINIAMMSDFHGDGHAKDPGELRLADQRAYFEACKRHSDTDFLLVPGEEPNNSFGGHYTMVFPRPVYWTHVREDGKPFEEEVAEFGKVYHVGSGDDELKMLRNEGGLVWQAHPRTKGSTYYPYRIKDTDYFQSDRYLGAAFQSLPVDLSESRICEERCFGTLDDMNNWGDPKYLISEGDTYNKFPEDEIYPHLMVNYVKLDSLPRFEQGWSPVLAAMRAGDFFITSGEILIPEFEVVDGAVEAMIHWTYPLEFIEVVWGDGSSVERTVVTATDVGPFGKKRFRIPFDSSGKKWVRVAAWDSAGNGAAAQPVHLKR